MNLDWQATARLLALVALGVAVLGVVIQTVADVSMHKRERTAAVGVALIGAGLLASSAILTAIDGDLVAAGGGLLALGMVLPAVFIQNSLTARLACFSGAVSVLLQGRTAWLKGEMSGFLWTSGIVFGVLAVLAAGVWLRDKSTKPKPRRDAHA